MHFSLGRLVREELRTESCVDVEVTTTSHRYIAYDDGVKNPEDCVLFFFYSHQVSCKLKYLS